MGAQVGPIDPQGSYTHALNPDPPGGVAAPPQESWFTPTVEYHVQPRADVMNRPDIVAEMMMPSSSALAIVSVFWDTNRNVLGDADGLPTPEARRRDQIIGVPDYGEVAAQSYRRAPNMLPGIPQGVQMSQITQNYLEYLRRVQNRLLGAP